MDLGLLALSCIKITLSYSNLVKFHYGNSLLCFIVIYIFIRQRQQVGLQQKSNKTYMNKE